MHFLKLNNSKFGYYVRQATDIRTLASYLIFSVQQSLIIALLILINGCIEVQDRNESSATLAPVSPLETQDSDIVHLNESGFVVAGDQLHEYSVMIPQASNSPIYSAQSAQRFNLDSSDPRKIEQVFNLSADSAFVDVSVAEGESYLYKFFRYENGQVEQINEVRLRIPVDVEFQGVIDLTDAKIRELLKNKKSGFTLGAAKIVLGADGEPVLRSQDKLHLQNVNRLVLHPQTLLITQGRNLKIEARELITDQSVVQTWPQDAKALMNQDGRSGGVIELYLKKASGVLKFEMRGEAGGDGSQGPMHSPAQASQGRAGENFLGGGDLVQFSCPALRAPEKGQDGKLGLPGHHGGQGGNTGRIVIEVSDSDLLTVDSQFKPGLGGAGGAGGPGQLGGSGGLKGGINCSFNTREQELIYRQDAPAGQNGTVGPWGGSGADGRAQTLCLKTPTRNNCEQN